jgi:hypothetical protein
MSITMNQRTFKVELFQGDDLDRLAELSQRLREAAKPRGQSTGWRTASTPRSARRTTSSSPRRRPAR